MNCMMDIYYRGYHIKKFNGYYHIYDKRGHFVDNVDAELGNLTNVRELINHIEEDKQNE